MQTLNLIQGTPEWHQHRNANYNASDAPSMMGESKYTSRDELLHRYKTGEVKEIDSATQKRFDDGHRFEAMARPIAEKIIGEEIYPITCSDTIKGLPLSASLDGATLDESIIFEHKSINDNLRANGGNPETLLEMYKIQMDQQLLLSGAQKCLFMASNGTAEDMVWCWYISSTDRENNIINGWEQFHNDLETYEPPTHKPEAVAGAIQQLPSLNIQIEGSVSQNNLVQYRESAMTYIEAIKTELQTDQDFADAEANVKFCKQAEDELKHAKAAALSSTADIDQLMKSVDFLSDQLRQKRLTLEKLVKSEKEARKNDIVHQAKNDFFAHVLGLENELNGLTLPEATRSADFYAAMKGKRTIESLHNAVNTCLAQAKIDADQAAKKLRANCNLLQGDDCSEYKHLFTDINQIAYKETDDLAILIKSRIQDEEKRVENQREQIRIEEERKAKQAEEERIAAEQAEAEKPAEPTAEIAEDLVPQNTEETPEPESIAQPIDYQYYKQAHTILSKLSAEFMQENGGRTGGYTDDYSISDLLEWSYSKTQAAA